MKCRKTLKKSENGVKLPEIWQKCLTERGGKFTIKACIAKKECCSPYLRFEGDKKVKKGILKKIACTTCVAMAAAVSLATFASCETSYPKAEIKLSFEGETYTLNYKLARKLAPATVRHFIELADEGYYDGVCIHDYTSSKWYTGGYKMASDGSLEELKYFDIVQSYDLTSTVWADQDGKDTTYTVYGEFSTNNYEVKSGAWKQTFGSISMYYTDKTSVDDQVYVQRYDGKKSYRLYRYNSATSLFYFYASSSAVSTDKYCTFGQLEDDSTDDFQSLVDAIADYTDDLDDGDEFTKEQSVSANTGDRWAEDAASSITVKVPVSPIVVVSVKIKKY